MKRLAFLLVTVLMVTGTTPSAVAQTPEQSTDLVEFSVHFYAPDQTTKHTSGGCRLSAANRHLHIHSADGDTASFLFEKGQKAPVYNACRFTFRTAVDPSVEQTFQFHKNELFTLGPDDLIERNTISITWDDEGSYEYETSVVGSIKPAPEPTEEPTAESGTHVDEDLNFTLTPPIAGVERAEAVVYSNVSESALFTEPLAITFVAYQFEGLDSAEQGMDALCENAESGLQGLTEAQYLREVSIGRIGDDRCAFNVDEPDSAASIWTVVRTGDQILVTMAIGIGGDYPDFIGGLLESYFDDIDGEDRFVLPELADMPRGWEGGVEPYDVLEETMPSTPIP